MYKYWVAKHLNFLGAMLLVLAVLNAWIAHTILIAHPIMALANGAMATVNILGVTLGWDAGAPGLGFSRKRISLSAQLERELRDETVAVTRRR